MFCCKNTAVSLRGHYKYDSHVPNRSNGTFPLLHLQDVKREAMISAIKLKSYKVFNSKNFADYLKILPELEGLSELKHQMTPKLNFVPHTYISLDNQAALKAVKALPLNPSYHETVCSTSKTEPKEIQLRWAGTRTPKM